MSMLVSMNRSNVRRIELKNSDGTVAGTITISKPVKKKRMRLQYNFKEISARILRTKTSGNARQVMTNARQKVAQLRRMSKSELYDEKELESAVIHAEAMARVAKKRMRHLQEEERAGEHGGICEAEIEEKTEEKAKEKTQDQVCSEEQAERAFQEMQELMQQYQELMQEAMEELGRESGMDELSEELMMSFDEDMDPEDLEMMKKKHRSDELREIMEADMKYLKALFDRLEKEKQSIGSSAGGSRTDSGVSLQLGGVDIPVQTTAASEVVPVEGGTVDTTV